MAWGVLPFSVGKRGAGLPLYLCSEAPITVASGTYVVLGTCVAASPTGLPGSWWHPRERPRGSWWPWSLEVPRGQAPFNSHGN